MPWESTRLSPEELREIRRGDQARFNRALRVVGWAVGAILHHIAAAMGSKDLDGYGWTRMVKSIPGYDPSVDEE